MVRDVPVGGGKSKSLNKRQAELVTAGHEHDCSLVLRAVGGIQSADAYQCSCPRTWDLVKNGHDASCDKVSFRKRGRITEVDCSRSCGMRGKNA